jgi:hypothetical protein
MTGIVTTGFWALCGQSVVWLLLLLLLLLLVPSKEQTWMECQSCCNDNNTDSKNLDSFVDIRWRHDSFNISNRRRGVRSGYDIRKSGRTYYAWYDATLLAYLIQHICHIRRWCCCSLCITIADQDIAFVQKYQCRCGGSSSSCCWWEEEMNKTFVVYNCCNLCLKDIYNPPVQSSYFIWFCWDEL